MPNSGGATSVLSFGEGSAGGSRRKSLCLHIIYLGVSVEHPRHDQFGSSQLELLVCARVGQALHTPRGHTGPTFMGPPLMGREVCRVDMDVVVTVVWACTGRGVKGGKIGQKEAVVGMDVSGKNGRWEQGALCASRQRGQLLPFPGAWLGWEGAAAAPQGPWGAGHAGSRASP